MIRRLSDFNSPVSLYYPLHPVIVARESLSRSAFVRSYCGLDTAKQVFQVHGVNGHGGVKARKTLAVRDGVGVPSATARHTWSGSRRVALPTHWARDLAKVGPTGELMATQYMAGLPRARQERPPTTRASCWKRVRNTHGMNPDKP